MVGLLDKYKAARKKTQTRPNLRMGMAGGGTNQLWNPSDAQQQGLRLPAPQGTQGVNQMKNLFGDMNLPNAKAPTPPTPAQTGGLGATPTVQGLGSSDNAVGTPESTPPPAQTQGGLGAPASPQPPAPTLPTAANAKGPDAQPDAAAATGGPQADVGGLDGGIDDLSLPGGYKSVNELANEYMSQDNELMQRARTQGAQFANRRGMLNSSMAAGAAQTAMLDAVLPMAQADALASLEWGMQTRELKTRMQINLDTIASNEGIAAAQRELDERLNMVNIDHEKEMQIRDLAFRGEMAAADRALEEALTDKTIASNEAISRAEIQSAESISRAQIESNEALTMAQIQSDRDLQAARLASNEALTMAQIASNEKIAEADNAIRMAGIQSNERVSFAEISSRENLAAEQRALDIVLTQMGIDANTADQIRDIQSREGLAAAQRALDKELTQMGIDANTADQIRDIVSRENLAAEQRALDIVLTQMDIDANAADQIRDIAAREGMAAAQRALDRELTQMGITADTEAQMRDIVSRENLAAAQRELDRQLSELNISADREAQIRDIAAREGMAAADRDLDRYLAQLADGTRKELTYAEIASRDGNAEAQRQLDEQLTKLGLDADREQQLRDIAFRGDMAELDRELQKDIKALDNEQREFDRDLQEQLTKLDLSQQDRNAASQFISNMETNYTNRINAINSNPNLSAEDRANQITAANAIRDTGLSLVEQQYDIDLDWGLEGEDSYSRGAAFTVVNDLYAEHLGRDPDPGGLEFWSDLLANGKITMEDLEAEFIKAKALNEDYSGQGGSGGGNPSQPPAGGTAPTAPSDNGWTGSAPPPDYGSLPTYEQEAMEVQWNDRNTGIAFQSDDFQPTVGGGSTPLGNQAWSVWNPTTDTFRPITSVEEANQYHENGWHVTPPAQTQ